MNNTQQSPDRNNMIEVDTNKICICLENMSNPNESIRNEATDYLE